MSRDIPSIIVGAIILVVIALSVVIVTGRPLAKAELSDARFELKHLDRGAADGIKDAFDTTRGGARAAQQKATEAIK